MIKASSSISVALLNFQAGGLCVSGGLRPGEHYELGPLATAFSELSTPPTLFALNEAKRWHQRGEEVALQAALMLSRRFTRPYDVRLLPSATGMHNALFYDTTELALTRWGNETVWPDKWGRCEFRVRDSTQPFAVFVDHWPYYCGDLRLQRARQIAYLADSAIPQVLLGDLNGTASGPHLPQRDWSVVPAATRAHKGMQLPDGTWAADCRAVDHLVGSWDQTHGRRVDGAGFHMVAELAPHEIDTHSFLPTVNAGVDAGGGLLIDHILINDAWLRAADTASLRAVTPDSYQVHLSQAPRPYSDHRMITAQLMLPPREVDPW